MKISLERISDYVALPSSLAPRELADDLTLKTVEVEGVETIEGDVVFEIDNKSLTNRPDPWGHYGIAREFAAIYGLPLGVRPGGIPDHQVAGFGAKRDLGRILGDLARLEQVPHGRPCGTRRRTVRS